MKKVKCFMVMSLIITSSLLLFSGCDKKNRLHMDADKCVEVALKYLEEKYQTEFEVLDSGEKMKYIGSAGYAEVIVSEKNGNEEDRYAIIVYPDGSSDEDRDGYYDFYKVISDDYMSELISKYAKKEINRMLMEAGLTRFISRVGIHEINKSKGFSGFSADFPIIDENGFSLEQLLDNYQIKISCMLEIPENEFIETLQENITSQFKPLISNDSFYFDIEVYTEETYNDREKLYIENESLFKYGNTNILSGITFINFSIKDEEDEYESK